MPRPTVIGGGLPASDPLGADAFSNATLTAISGPGQPDRTGDPTAGAVLWTGEVDCYLTRIRRTVITGAREATSGIGSFSSGGEQFLAQLDVLQIPLTAAAPILEVAGPDWGATTITVTDRRDPAGPAELTFRVNAMEHRAVGTLLDHLRLELEATSPPVTLLGTDLLLGGP